MRNDKEQLIPLREGELAILIREVGFVDVAFGTGGCALVWRDGESIPKAVEKLGYMRGVLNENCDGAGI